MQVTLISKGAVAEIDTLGAQLVSFQDVVNTEYLWQGIRLLERAGADSVSHCRRFAGPESCH